MTRIAIILILLFSVNLLNAQKKHEIKEGKEYTSSSGLKYIFFVVNKTAPKADSGDVVYVHYVGKYADGTEFDNSFKRNEPFRFTLGQGLVIKGWEEGIQLMHVGDSALFTIPPELAYGDREMGGIKPNSTLKYTVKLVKVEKAKKPKIVEAKPLNKVTRGRRFKKNKANGLYYKFYAVGTNPKSAHVGDLIEAYLVYRTMNDSIFGGGKQQYPSKIHLLEPIYEGDIFAALAMMHIGDSARFIMNTDSFFTNIERSPRPAFLESAPTFYIDIKVVDIKTKDELEQEAQEEVLQMIANEQKSIAKYLVDKNITVAPDENGLYIIEQKKGNGAMVTHGDYAKLNIVASTLFGGQFINTYATNKPYTMEVGSGQLGVGFEVALSQMHEGDKIMLIAPSSMAFGEKGVQGYIPPYSPIVYEIELLKVMSAEELNADKEAEQKRLADEEQAKIDAYVKANGITATPTASGLIYIVETPSQGAQVNVGDKVKVHYTGYFLDGTKFDSSVDRGQAFEFVVGEGRVIPGWDEAVSKMHVGEKVKIILPSHLAYGAQGAGREIPPFSPLIFGIELIGIVK